jgi:hypothetical protein
MSVDTEFADVMVQDCWVLGWRTENDSLVFDIEASLTSGHPLYEPPKQGEWSCYKAARIIFSGVREISGLLPIQSVRATVGSDGSVDYGSIDSITQESGGFAIAGEFGKVMVSASAVQLHLVA